MLHGCHVCYAFECGEVNVQGSMNELATVHELLLRREARQLTQLQRDVAGGTEAAFDLWMKQRSELVQGTAEAYADREVAEASKRALEGLSPALTAILYKVVLLDGLCRVSKHMTWYLLEGLVSPAAAREVCYTTQRYIELQIKSERISDALIPR